MFSGLQVSTPNKSRFLHASEGTGAARAFGVHWRSTSALTAGTALALWGPVPGAGQLS